MNPLQSLISRLTNAEEAAAPEDLKTRVQAWNKTSAPDWQQPHFHVRYVVCGFAQDPEQANTLSFAALGLQGGRVSPDDALLLTFEADPALRANAVEAWLNFIGQGILVAYRADSGIQALRRMCEETAGESIDPPVLDLALLLPELFPEGQDQCRYFGDWARYFDLPESHDSAMEDALLVARLWQAVLLKASAQGTPTPAELRKLEKARRWLWTS